MEPWVAGTDEAVAFVLKGRERPFLGSVPKCLLGPLGPWAPRLGTRNSAGLPHVAGSTHRAITAVHGRGAEPRCSEVEYGVLATGTMPAPLWFLNSCRDLCHVFTYLFFKYLVVYLKGRVAEAERKGGL